MATNQALSTPEASAGFLALDGDARALAEAAEKLAAAETPEQLGEALALNLSVWVAIKTIVATTGDHLPAALRRNFEQLAVFVIRVTLGNEPGGIKVSTIETMVRINLHIAEGLMRSERNRLVRDRAYSLWEAQGRPSGREMENWLRAEQDIQSSLAAG